MNKKPKFKKTIKPQSTMFLTICSDCKIRLVVFNDSSKKCSLCKSPNVTVSTWR